MTREENLHWIDEEIRTWENECQSKHPIKEALHAARKALEQEPCEDAVSRKSVITIIQNHWWNCRDIDKLVNDLPSVTPQEPRKGHWIEHPHECGINWEYSMYECSECHEWAEDDSDFCPNCGADMREDKE